MRTEAGSSQVQADGSRAHSLLEAVGAATLVTNAELSPERVLQTIVEEARKLANA